MNSELRRILDSGLGIDAKLLKNMLFCAVVIETERHAVFCRRILPSGIGAMPPAAVAPLHEDGTE
ncbi:MAG: hypothetical protein GVY13_10330 [Alphaproteobacteria bacterium]|nr:hypothetical protein [Alphaproteobacteria bacterium]